MPNLLMAYSANGYTAASPDDDMRWTGRMDKRIFRLLTQANPHLAIGRTSYNLMPDLAGRQMYCLSRLPDVCYPRETTIGAFARNHPDGWILGGIMAACSAIDLGHIKRAFLVQSPNNVTPCFDSDQQANLYQVSWLHNALMTKGFEQFDKILFEEHTVFIYNHRGEKRDLPLKTKASPA